MELGKPTYNTDHSKSSIPYWILLAGALVWVFLIFLPVIDGLDGAMKSSSALIYLFFKPICHQRPERCFWIAGVPLPVCARCLGIYLGGVLGLIYRGLTRGSSCMEVPSEAWIGIGLAPLALDGLMNASGLFSTPASIRAVTGLIAGAIMAAVLAGGAAAIFQQRNYLTLNHDGAGK